MILANKPGCLFVLVTISALLVGCNDDDSSIQACSPAPETTPDPVDNVDPPGYDRYRQDPSSARFRFIHAMDDTGSIDLVLGSGPSPLVEGVPYPGSLPYAPFPPGTYELNYHSTGTNDGLVYEPGLFLDGNNFYTHLLYGTVEGGNTHPDLGPAALLLEDDISAPANGMARVRPVNIAGTTASAVGATGINLWDTFLLESIDYGEAGTLREVPAGDVSWGVDFNSDGEPDVSFNFTVASGDTANLYFLAGNTDIGEPAVAELFVHHTTSPDPDSPATYFDENSAIQVIAVPWSAP